MSLSSKQLSLLLKVGFFALKMLFGRFIICLLISVGVAIALECYTCDSAEDAECATRPGQQINVEECPNQDDECVTVIVAGITRRGCLSRLFPNKYCAAPCDHCNTSLCNRHIFPADRLRCYQCVGAECIDVKNKPNFVLPCPIYNEKDRCYTNVIGTSNVQRGCEYTNLPPTCPNVCLKCNYDGCNNELGVHEQVCLECRHNSNSPNPDCLRNQHTTVTGIRCALTGIKTCTNKLLHGHTGKCFTYINEQTGVVERGCSTTKGFYPSGELTECYGKNCNRDCLTIACNNCTSSAQGYNCRLGVALRTQKCEENTFSCMSCEAGSLLRRGCANDTFEPLPGETCYKCRNADGCNKAPARSCYHCSSLDHPDCSTLTNPSQIETRNCTSANELCVSTLMNKYNLVYTLRGCSSQVPECTHTDPYCARCNGSLCNQDKIVWKHHSVSELQLKNHELDVRNGGHIFVLQQSFFAVLIASILYLK